MLLVHHRHVVETIEIRQGLQIRLVLDQLFGAAVQQADMRVGALHHLAVHLQHEPQHAVGRRMLRPEVQGEVPDFGLGHRPAPPPCPSPARTAFAPSHGLMKSNRRYSWVNETGS